MVRLCGILVKNCMCSLFSVITIILNHNASSDFITNGLMTLQKYKEKEREVKKRKEEEFLLKIRLG